MRLRCIMCIYDLHNYVLDHNQPVLTCSAYLMHNLFLFINELFFAVDASGGVQIETPFEFDIMLDGPDLLANTFKVESVLLTVIFLFYALEGC